MKQFDYTIQEAVGIHARPAGLLVKEVKKYKSTVTVIKGDKSSNALKLMALMGICSVRRCITLPWKGEDEDAAAPALEAFFRAFVIDHFVCGTCSSKNNTRRCSGSRIFCFRCI